MATYTNFDGQKRSRAWRSSITQMTWATGEGHVAQTETISAIGEVKMICIRISSVTGNPTSAITITDALGNTLQSYAALADGTDYVYTPTEFLPTAESFIVAGEITISVDPSADAGGSGQTLTVDIDIFGV